MMLRFRRLTDDEKTERGVRTIYFLMNCIAVTLGTWLATVVTMRESMDWGYCAVVFGIVALFQFRSKKDGDG